MLAQGTGMAVVNVVQISYNMSNFKHSKKCKRFKLGKKR